jgi:hypothetical protein
MRSGGILHFRAAARRVVSKTRVFASEVSEKYSANGPLSTKSATILSAFCRKTNFARETHGKTRKQLE